ncbi:MAG: tRNA pseudouridine(38-40) synthase TruA [Erysipelotrichaceae bacterium]
MRYKAIVAYDGSNYCGWQTQKRGDSIEETIEKALSTMHKCQINIVGAGRTDGGVHAYGQVFHFDSDKVIDSEHYTRGLNSLLPRDIRIQSVDQVSDDFHARFSSTAKQYDYLISKETKNPMLQKYMKLDWAELDVEAMCQCAEVFVGTHDFTSFTSNKIDPRKSRIRTIDKIEIIKEKDYLRLIFIGNGFLRYMVRMITQVLIEAGKHTLSKDDLIYMLEAKDKDINRYKAESHGLYLMKVFYEERL